TLQTKTTTTYKQHSRQVINININQHQHQSKEMSNTNGNTNLPNIINVQGTFINPPNFGTNMFIDSNSIPEQQLLFSNATDNRNADRNLIRNIPSIWPPKYHNYVDGRMWFTVRRKDN